MEVEIELLIVAVEDADTGVESPYSCIKAPEECVFVKFAENPVSDVAITRTVSC